MPQSLEYVFVCVRAEVYGNLRALKIVSVRISNGFSLVLLPLLFTLLIHCSHSVSRQTWNVSHGFFFLLLLFLPIVVVFSSFCICKRNLFFSLCCFAFLRWLPVVFCSHPLHLQFVVLWLLCILF